MRKYKNLVLPALVILAIAAWLGVDAARRSANTAPDLPEMVIQSARLGPPEDGYYPLALETNRGEVECRYSPSAGAQRGAILVGGAGGGWGDTAARGLYARLCRELPGEGVACLRVRYRNVDDPLECILDVMAGLQYLQDQGIHSAALVGHSRGGMIVMYAAAAAPQVRAVVTLATEGVEGELAARLGPRCSILLIHGQNDSAIPCQTSEDLYQMARQPKRLIIYPGADHRLDSVADEVYREVYRWIAPGN